MSVPTLVGRSAEPSVLRQAVADVAIGRGGAVWVEGEQGAGKSALLAVGLEGASAAGCDVFPWQADEMSQRFPLRILLDCLRVGADSPDDLRARIVALMRRDVVGGTPIDSTG